MRKREFMMTVFATFILHVTLILPSEGRQNIRAEIDDEETIHKSSEIKFFGTLQSVDVKSRGKILLSDDDEDVKSISEGGYLRIRKTTFGNKKEILIESDHSGNISKYYYDNKTELPFEPEGRRWLRDILPEVVRSTGIAAQDRVNRFFKEDGVDGVLDEIEEISSNSVKSRYFGLLLQKNGLNGRDLSRIAREVTGEISSSSQQGDIFRKYSHKFLAGDESAEEYFRGVGRISSSSEQGYTLRQVLKSNELTSAMQVHLLEASEDISSSSEKGAVLREFNEVFDDDPEVVEAYFDAIDWISSSSEKGSVLRDLLKLEDLSESTLSRLFESVDGISSSSEKGSVLNVAIGQVDGKEGSFKEFFHTVGNISSSSEKGYVLREMLEEATLGPEFLGFLFEAIDKISSSSEKGAVLRKAIIYIDDDQKALTHFMRAVENVSSSSERGYVLTEFASHGEPSDATLIAILEASEAIPSSSTRVDVMLAVAERINSNSRQVLDVYKKVAKSIESTSGYRTVMERVF